MKRIDLIRNGLGPDSRVTAAATDYSTKNPRCAA
jgi:hypothetical protein